VTTHERGPVRRRFCGALALGPIVALLLLVPRAAAAAISAGPTVDVPWLQDSFPEVTAAVLADGSFAIASTEVFQLTRQEVGVRLQAQFFRANGGAQTRPLVLIRPPGVVTYAGVGSLGTRYFLAWQDLKRAHAAFYSQQGALLGPPFPWPHSDVPFFAAHYRFGNAPRWRFLPLTYDFAGVNDDVPYYHIFLRAAQPTGALLGPPVELAPPPLIADVEDAAINGSGRFVVVSHQCSPCIRAMQIFDGAVTPRTPLLTAGVPQFDGPAGTTVNGIGSAVVMDPQGRVLLSWVTDLDQPAHRIVIRLYDQQGAPLSDVLQIGGEAPLGGPLTHGLKALDDGTFVVSWLVSSPPNDTARLFVEHIDLRTGTFDEPVAVAEGPIVGALLELNGAGKGVMVWQTQEFNALGDLVSSEGHLRVIRVKP